MSSDATYNVTKQDVRKAESEAAARHGGNVPAGSEAAGLQSMVDSKTDKASQIEERKGNLPLPEDPPVASDFNSAQQDTVNVGAGRFSGNAATDEHASALREPATADSSVRTSAEEWKTNVAPTSGTNIGRES
ncbi:hypothetical protein FQN54_009132 [Arachnomyces sp. PD_36]|nr:hypothetical protein FQN54_009132 [Arachnomyces sp. PD_36]